MFPATYHHAYHQSLVYKIMIGRKQPGASSINAEEALDIIESMHYLTGGLKQIVYLVGWQFEGHDSKYPSWAEVNPRLKRPEDEDALSSLLWLMETARERFGAIVSLHINVDDAYDNSPLWSEYLEKGLIRTTADGRPKEAGVWDGEMSYHVSKPREWRAGLMQRRIEGLLELLPPLREGHTIHIDAFRPQDPMPHEAETFEDEMQTAKELLLYWRERGIDVTTEFFAYHELAGLLPLAWHLNLDESSRLRYAPSVLVGGDAAGNQRHSRLNRLPQWGGSFLTPEAGCKYEEAWGIGVAVDICHAREVARFGQTFCHETLTWYLLNRERAVNHTHTAENYSVEFSDGTSTNVRVADRHLTVEYRGRLVVNGTEGCLPALWRERLGEPCDHIAYSREGGLVRWQLTPEWERVFEARILPVSPLPPSETPCNVVRIEDGWVTLEMQPGEAVWLQAVG